MGVALKIQQWFEEIRQPSKSENVVVQFKKKDQTRDNFDIFCFDLSDSERACCLKATD